MASDVTIHAPAYMPLKFPPRCCYCLEPATTTVPVTVAHRKVRVSRTRTTSITYPVEIPYCAAHGAQARRMQRYDRRATVVLGVAAAVALFAIQLLVGRALRAYSGLVWYGATLLLIALLVVGAMWLYAVGRWLLKRRYPATADHVYRSGLGVSIATRVARRLAESESVVLAITFTCHNEAFAAMLAALHDTQAHAASGPPEPP